MTHLLQNENLVFDSICSFPRFEDTVGHMNIWMIKSGFFLFNISLLLTLLASRSLEHFAQTSQEDDPQTQHTRMTSHTSIDLRHTLQLGRDVPDVCIWFTLVRITYAAKFTPTHLPSAEGADQIHYFFVVKVIEQGCCGYLHPSFIKLNKSLSLERRRCRCHRSVATTATWLKLWQGRKIGA